MAASDPGPPGTDAVFSRDRAARLPLLRRAAVAVVFGGIELHGYVRHFVPWHEVAGFRVRGQAGPTSGQDDVDPPEHIEVYDPWLNQPGRRLSYGGRQTPPPQPRLKVQVVRTSGRRLVLPAPVVVGRVGDPQFTDVVKRLEQWREQYGLPAPGRAPW